MTASIVRTPAPESALTLADFRSAMRELAGGISVITVGCGENRTGLTVTSVTSLSAEPPLVLFCLNRASSSWDIIRTQRIFAINIIPVEMKHVAERFSGFGGLKGSQRYEDASWRTLVTGASILDGALAALDCEVDELIERGSHAIVIGRVLAAKGSGILKSSALTYWRGRYGHHTDPA